MTKLLFLAGSTRKDSLNKKLAKYASIRAAAMGAEVKFIDLADFEMPIYNGDYEEANGLPENAIKLKNLFIEHDGFFIASPEYNSSFPPVLKNALVWISRPHEDNEESLKAYNNKVAALGAVSPGGLGGIRGLVPLRMMLGNINVTLTPTQVCVSDGYNAFNDEGDMIKDDQKGLLEKTVKQFVETAQKLSA